MTEDLVWMAVVEVVRVLKVRIVDCQVGALGIGVVVFASAGSIGIGWIHGWYFVNLFKFGI